MTTHDSDATVDAQALQARLRKVVGKASRLKLDLHDLAEDLPSNWEQIPELAGRTFDAYAEIASLQAELAARGGTS